MSTHQKSTRGHDIDLASRRGRGGAAITACAAAPVRFVPAAFLRATDGLFPGFSVPDLELLRALP